MLFGGELSWPVEQKAVPVVVGAARSKIQSRNAHLTRTKFVEQEALVRS